MATLRRIAALVAALACLCWLPAAAQPDFGRYHALVIGNNGYRHLPQLKTAAGDARAVADLLRARYGFQVELLLDADRDTTIRAVNRYRAVLGESDNFLIYYAGHGLIDEATDRGFWLPVDAEAGNEARWIDIALISSNLRAMQARHVIVIADSCYAGSLVRASQEAGLATGGERAILLARMRERRARMALTSGSLEPVVDSGGSGHSVFANALLGVLRENADIVSGGELFTRLRARVVAHARQTPLYADIRFAGHEGGDFLFVPRGATIELSSAAAPDVSEAALELAFWNAIKDSVIPDDYQAYLDAFPSGRFAPLARRRAELPAAPRPSIRRPTAPQLAALPPAAPANPAVLDAAGLAAAWPSISLVLRRQYDRSWALSDWAIHLNEIKSYRVDALTADEITLTLDYMVQDRIIGGTNGFARPRLNQVRFRNRAPGFAVLQWGQVPAETVLPNAEQFAIHWETIRDSLMAQYDRHFALADGAFDMAEIGAFRVERLDGEEIVVALEYTPNPIGGPPVARGATVRLDNRSPGFRIRQWGDLAATDGDLDRARLKFRDAGEARQFWPILRRALEQQYAASIRFRTAESVAGAAESGPPAEMSIRRYEITAVDDGALNLALSYEVAGSGAGRHDRQAAVTLRNAGPEFEILDWQRQ